MIDYSDGSAPSFPLYARQFVCEPIDGTLPGCAANFRAPEGFATTSFAGNYVIHAHPLLPVTRATTGEAEIVLLGFFVDPLKPDKEEHSILQEILAHPSVENLTRLVHGLTGRFLLFFSSGSSVLVLADACGLRQLHYCPDRKGRIWCFTQPDLVRDTLGLEVNPEARDFWNHGSTLSDGCWWPGDTSLYTGVRRLLPNHYLDLENGTPNRFWPSSPLPSMPYTECRDMAANLLRGSIAGALGRAPLALPITAGIDSRLLLAAARPFLEKIKFYTMRYANMPEEHEDLSVARRLASIAKLSWSVLPCPAAMTPDFEDLYQKNCIGAHPVWGAIAQGLFDYYPHGRWCVKGNASEISRCMYYLYGRPIPRRRLTGSMFCNLYNMEGSAFAAAHFQEWISGACPACDLSGIILTDLFKWEEVMGSWQASSQLEWDTVMETITPYNNRLLLETMLSVPDHHRRGPVFEFHRDLIRHMWPELLSLPFNPDQARLSVKMKNAAHDAVRLLATWSPDSYYPLKQYYRRCFKRH